MTQSVSSNRLHRRASATVLLRRALLPSMIAGVVGVAQAQSPAPVTTAVPAEPAAAPATPAATQELDSVQVRGVRGSATGAVDAKQAKPEISDSVVAEDIRKLPDNSVAAALQRVTGVQVARSGAEVGTVLVRGLPDVATTFDGRNVFTASGRGIALQDTADDRYEHEHRAEADEPASPQHRHVMQVEMQAVEEVAAARFVHLHGIAVGIQRGLVRIALTAPPLPVAAS